MFQISQSWTEMFLLQVQMMLCFVFTYLETADPYLSEKLADYTDSLKVKIDGGVVTSKQDLWYYSDKVITSTRERSKTFYDFATAQKNNSRMSFLVAAMSNEKYKEASIHHYKKTILDSDDFSNNEITDVEILTDRRELILCN